MHELPEFLRIDCTDRGWDASRIRSTWSNAKKCEQAAEEYRARKTREKEMTMPTSISAKDMMTRTNHKTDMSSRGYRSEPRRESREDIAGVIRETLDSIRVSNPQPQQARVAESEPNPIITIDPATGRIKNTPRPDMNLIRGVNSSVKLTDEQTKSIAAQICVSNANDVKYWSESAIWALAIWQRGQGFPATGRMTKQTVERLGVGKNG